MSSKRIKKKIAKNTQCPLCNKKLLPDPSSYVVGPSGWRVCKNCIQTASRMGSIKPQVNTDQITAPNILTPDEILSRLNKWIIGQDRAKNAVAVAMWKQQLRRDGESNLPGAHLLLYGPTGCGKTAIVQAAAEIVGLPFISFDATTLTETGYRGRDADDIIKDLFVKHSNSHGLEYAVVFIDEFDKIAATAENEYRAENNRGTQSTLLKLLEGRDAGSGEKMISTKNMLFIFGGAFQRLYTSKNKRTRRAIGFDTEYTETCAAPEDISVHDLVSYGIEPELLGRIHQCIPVEQLTEDAFRRILLEAEGSTFRQYQRFFEVKGVELVLPEASVKAIAQEAIARGTGARGLNTLIESAVEPLMFQLAQGTLSGRVELKVREKDAS